MASAIWGRLKARWGWESFLYLVILSLAAGLRLWDLGSKTLHHDESLHAYFSWLLSEGRGYQHDPMMHGPFLFEGTAFLFKIFGDRDYTVRLLQALFGIGLVGLPYFLRDYLGRRGALLASLMLAVSPSMLYVSRYARHDMIAATWALALAVCLWRYMKDPRPRYLYIGAAVLALGFASMEVTFIYVAIFGSFLIAVATPELWRQVRKGFEFFGVSPPAAFAVLLGTLTLPLLSAFSIIPFRWLGVELSSLQDYAPYLGWKIGIVVALLALSVAVAWRWNLRRWLVAALIFWAIYLVFYTTFFSNMRGFATGLWGSVDYWLAQHDVRRGDQPWYYYTLLLSTYEFLPLLFAMIGAVYFTLKGDLFSRFLVFWSGGSFVLFTYAGEKMPWLMVHMALPLILLAARFLGDALRGEVRLEKSLGMASLAVVPLAIKTSSVGSFDLLWMLAGVLGVALYLIWRRRAWPLARGLLWALLSALLVLSALVALRLSFQLPDIPRELLVYTQSSPDVKRIKGEIDRLARETEQGQDLEIRVDGADGYAWPWAWYLRDYKKVNYSCLAAESESGCSPLKEPPTSSVVLLNARNESLNREQLKGYADGVTFSLRWWFPEYYRQQSLPRLLFGVLDSKKWGPWWDFFWRRELLEPIGSADAIAYFPQGFSLKVPMPSQAWR
ncbi:MAG: TIGR03663 family protein [Chloroflexi bacterium]|nr:TIGR03663 family protein [Chloroflexota bacterium]